MAKADTPQLQVSFSGCSVIGPGLDDWEEARQVLSGHVPWQSRLLRKLTADILPARERRRTSPAMRLALSAALAACQNAGCDPQQLASVFVSAFGSGTVTERILKAISAPGKQVSPTDFHNSVHNAVAGYWSIATGNHRPSVSLAAGDYGFAVGLLRASLQVFQTQQPVLFVCYDMAMPESLHSVRPVGNSFAIGLVVTPVTAGPGFHVGVVQGHNLSQLSLRTLAQAGTESATISGLALMEGLATGTEAPVLLPMSAANQLRLVPLP